MKPTAPTLSQHLLDEATKFQFYPKRMRRTKVNLEAQKMLDDTREAVVADRLTFAPYQQYPGEKLTDPTYLDEWYCRNLLREVPEMVRRALALDKMALPESANLESLFYLRESASCLVYGLSQAAVVLARTAVESCLRAVCVRAGLDEHKVRGLDIDDMLNNPDIRKVLPEDWVTRKRANDVRIVANRVLHHDSLIEAEKALKVYEAARSVILSVTGS